VDGEHTDTDLHTQTARLVPWLVNGTLDAEGAATVRAHLADCAQCRADFDSQVQLYEAMRSEGPLVFAAEPSFQKLMARIEAGEQAVAPPAPERTRRHRIAPRRHDEPGIGTRSRQREQPHPLRAPAIVRWLAAAVVIEALGLSFAAWMWHARESTAAPYVTLTSPAPSFGTGAHARVVFKSGMTLDELAALLRSTGAHIEDGPTEANVYTLGFAPAITATNGLSQQVARLRASEFVLFAEPVSAGNPSP